MATIPAATSIEVAKNLFLVRQLINIIAAPPIETSTNHVVILDCSGSMGDALPKIRDQLKRKLPKLLRDGDTLSMIWFSGRGQCGSLFEGEAISGLADLNETNRLIDRWLRPVGMTGFKEPLVEAAALIQRVSKKNKNPWSMFFMSDGCDNQWSRTDILKAVETAAGGLAASTFVEYGYYADRNLLAAMAEKAGGTLIHADAFDKFEAVLDDSLQKRPAGGKKIEVEIKGDVIGGFVFSMADNEITTYSVEGGPATITATVSPDVTTLWYLSPTMIGVMKTDTDKSGPITKMRTIEAVASYAAMSLFAVRCKPDVVYPLLKLTGDVRFINMFSTCFGKQKYSEFMDATKAAAFDPTKRLVNGYDPTLVPADDAFTVLDLLKVLSEDLDARLLLEHPAFQYSRISRGTVSADENLSADEAATVEGIRLKMAGEKKAAVLKKLQAEIDAILAAKQDALTFVAEPAPEGYPVLNLTYNQERPNISVLVKKAGKVNLRERFMAAPGGEWKIGMRADPVGRNMDALGVNIDAFETFIYRNYAIVRDGLVNVEKLPVMITLKTYDHLRNNGVAMVGDPDTLGKYPFQVIIDVKPLPILNRKMVNASVSAASLVKLEYALIEAQARAKVFNTIRKEKFPDAKLAGWAEKFGDEGAAWLKDQGLTEYGGFAPKRVQAESVDFYVGKELVTKLKGLSSSPSVKEVREKMEKAVVAHLKAGGKVTDSLVIKYAKLTGWAALMAPAIVEVDGVIAKNTAKDAQGWITIENAKVTAETRKLLREIAQLKIGVTVGQVWPIEFKTMDENTLTVEIPGGPSVTATLAMGDVEVRI